MADRGFSAAMLTEVNADANQPIHLFVGAFDSGTVYVTDAARTVSWGGNDYLANGHFLNFGGIIESADLQVSEASVELSAVDQTWIALVLGENYIDRQLIIYKGFLATADDALVVDPEPIFDGRMDSPSIVENPDTGETTVTLTATSRWVDFERRAGRHTNLADQQIHFASDTAFKYVTDQTKQITWGAV